MSTPIHILFSLTAKKQHYVGQKKTISQEIQTKNEFLNSLEPKLKNILKVHVGAGLKLRKCHTDAPISLTHCTVLFLLYTQATSPIQEFLGIQLESKRIKYQTAKYLPRFVMHLNGNSAVQKSSSKTCNLTFYKYLSIISFLNSIGKLALPCLLNKFILATYGLTAASK